MKKEFQIISELIENNTRVLDVGCGDGVLMKHLKDIKNIPNSENKFFDSKLLIVIFDTFSLCSANELNNLIFRR